MQFFHTKSGEVGRLACNVVYTICSLVRSVHHATDVRWEFFDLVMTALHSSACVAMSFFFEHNGTLYCVAVVVFAHCHRVGVIDFSEIDDSDHFDNPDEDPDEDSDEDSDDSEEVCSVWNYDPLQVSCG